MLSASSLVHASHERNNNGHLLIMLRGGCLFQVMCATTVLITVLNMYMYVQRLRPIPL